MRHEEGDDLNRLISFAATGLLALAGCATATSTSILGVDNAAAAETGGREPKELHALGDNYFYKQGDPETALAIYRSLLTCHPEYEGCPQVLESLVACYEQRPGDWPQEEEVLGRFADDYRDRPELYIRAAIFMARAQEKQGKTAEALVTRGKVVAYYEAGQRLGQDIAGGEYFYAEAKYFVTDAGFDDYDRLQMKVPQRTMETNLKKRIELSQNLIRDYTEIASLGIPEWSIAAHNRMGDVYASFATCLRHADIPEELQPTYWEPLPASDERKFLLANAYAKYAITLGEQSIPLDDKARAEYEEALSIAKETNNTGLEWAKSAQTKMAASIKSGPTSVDGDRAPAKISKFVRAYSAGLNDAYDNALKNDPVLGSGTIVLKFTIADDGIVTSASILSSTFNAPSFEAAVAEAARWWRFPKGGEGDTDVIYPLTFPLP